MCHCKWAHQRCKDQLTYVDIIDGCGSDQREFFKKIEKMFHGTVERSYQSCAPPSELANKFADFFDNKIKVIADVLQIKSTNLIKPLPESLPLCGHIKFGALTSINETELTKFPKKIANESCILDPIPAKVLRERFARCSADRHQNY